MKKRYIVALLLTAMAINGVHAQDNTNLNKEITLEKDIAPLEKKAVKRKDPVGLQRPDLAH